MNRSKILLSRNSRLYIIQQNGPILESEIENEYMFNSIGMSNMTYSYNNSKVFIGNIAYLSIFYELGVHLYRFNLSDGSMIKLSVFQKVAQLP
ncbi:unnamed protein product [Blepharisma stoltei]|uniref:Uncharacterized protein n=1 Tax=Blepharisma stoltei TaxID=1481888 RepID=A0AAU9J046_9CILI|nr:unnamed protein product [Blepharisma stoltei]